MKYNKAIAYVSAFVIMMVLSVSIFVVKADSPSISISPDITFQKNEVETVTGINFIPNVSVRIDLLLPDSSVVEGIISGMVNQNGNFTLSFTSPDKNGDGYVKAISGSIVMSVLVHFDGTKSSNNQLQVNINPNLLIEGQTSHITVLASFLETKNYIVDFLMVNPLGQDTLSYYVLHKGKVEFDYEFDMAGYYWLNISIEDTEYHYTQFLQVNDNPNDDGGGGNNNNYNVSFEISSNNNIYEIMLWRETYGYITSGNLSVRSPDGKTTNILIKNSVATYTATKMGTYTVKYISSGKQFSTTFEYKVTITFTSSPFDNDGKSRLLLLVNGEKPTGNIQVNVSGAVDDTINLEDGEYEYTATIIGEYQFQIYYMGVTKTTKEIYEDTYEISTIEAYVDGDYIIVTGTVMGEKTQTGGCNIRIQISIPSQNNYKTIITTTNDGTFECTIDVVNKGNIPMGIECQIRANIQETGQTTTYKSTTVHLSHDIWNEYGWIIILLIILIVVVMWYKGIFYKISGGRIPPPKRAMRGARAKEDSDMGF